MQLDQVRFESGLKLLKLLDKFQAEVLSAAWVLNDEDWWDFCVVTPLLDKQGPLWLATQLATIHKYVELPKEITPLNLVYLSPKNVFFQDFNIVTIGDMDSYDKIISGLVSEETARRVFPKLPKIKSAFFYRAGEENKGKYIIYPKDGGSSRQFKKSITPGKFFAKQVKRIMNGTLTAEQVYN